MPGKRVSGVAVRWINFIGFSMGWEEKRGRKRKYSGQRGRGMKTGADSRVGGRGIA